jgi:hypothetical protein
MGGQNPGCKLFAVARGGCDHVMAASTCDIGQPSRLCKPSQLSLSQRPDRPAARYRRSIDESDRYGNPQARENAPVRTAPFVGSS